MRMVTTDIALILLGDSQRQHALHPFQPRPSIIPGDPWLFEPHRHGPVYVVHVCELRIGYSNSAWGNAVVHLRTDLAIANWCLAARW